MPASVVGLLWAVVAGAAVLRCTPPSRLPVSPSPPEPLAVAAGPRRRAGLLVAGAVVAAGIVATQPVVAIPAAAGGLALWALRRRGRQRRREDAVVDQLPDVVDLLRLTNLAGLPVAAALTVVGARPGGPLGEAIAHAAGMVRYGASTTDALQALGEAAGPPARGLVEALADHDRYGSSLGAVLDRVAIEARQRRRRRAEEAARRLPVTLLFPLVLTTLPAFVLLTVVPLLVSALSALQQ